MSKLESFLKHAGVMPKGFGLPVEPHGDSQLEEKLQAAQEGGPHISWRELDQRFGEPPVGPRLPYFSSYYRSGGSPAEQERRRVQFEEFLDETK